MAELKPCPFCGGEVKKYNRLLIFIKCQKCGATISFDNDVCNRAPTKAVKYYNTRTPKE
jgi:hypothetical protein